MCPVERFNPSKSSVTRFKRSRQRGGRSGQSVAIHELTLAEVRQDAMEFGLVSEVILQLRSGKEADVYLGVLNGFPLVLKAYRLWRTSRAGKKRGFFAPGRMEVLAAKEYDVLLVSFRAGVPVPTPVGRVANYVTMRFIGDGTTPAPRLREVHPEDPGAVLDQILADYLAMYSRAHYVHGDLSPYNILWWRNRAWFIDMPQAYHVDPWCNLEVAVRLLRRDLNNVLNHFESYDIIRDEETVLRGFLASYVPRNLRDYVEDVLD